MITSSLAGPSHLIVALVTQPFSRTEGVDLLLALAQSPCPFQWAALTVRKKATQSTQTNIQEGQANSDGIP